MIPVVTGITSTSSRGPWLNSGRIAIRKAMPAGIGGIEASILFHKSQMASSAGLNA